MGPLPLFMHMRYLFWSAIIQNWIGTCHAVCKCVEILHQVTDYITACFGGDKGVALQHWGGPGGGQRGDTWAGEPENL